MQISDSFTVAPAPQQVWAFLLDVERVAPCMPGAELTEVIDDSSWRGRVKLKIGPITMKYAGNLRRVERDDAQRRMTLVGEGAEENGKGRATVTVTAAVEAAPEGGSTVKISQDLALSGAAAQFGSRMIADVSARITRQFADSLESQLTGQDADTGQAVRPVEAKPVPALRLALWAVARAVARFLRLPWGRKRGAQS